MKTDDQQPKNYPPSTEQPQDKVKEEAVAYAKPKSSNDVQCRFTITELAVMDKLSPPTFSVAMEDSVQTIRLHGKLQTSELIPEATEYGFIYSNYGDPLTGMENQGWEYWRIPGEGTDAAAWL